MQTEVPIPTQMLTASWDTIDGWLLGLGAATALAVIVLAVRDREPKRRRRRLGALAVTYGALFVPGAWATTVHGITAWPIWLAAYAVAGMVGLYVSDLIAATEPTPRPRPAPKARPATPTSPPKPPPRPAAPKAPVIRPPAEGAVAAGGDRGVITSPDTQGLLSTLREGPEFARPAAARALALGFADSAQPEVARTLLDALADEDAADVLRAECWVALHRVFGDTLEWEAEVAIRRDFPEGLDDERVLAWEARLSQ